MPPRTAQKRAARQSGESSVDGGANHASKKTRFVEPAEDPATFAEQVDSALENPSKKGKVKTEGYDSDSSDDGEGVVQSRKKPAEGADDDDDMFAVGEKEGKTDDEKKDNFMRLGDIEGQEFGDNSGASSEEEPEDEDAVERKKKVGMGYELSSFNMRDEMEEGKFTEDGNYVRTFDPHGVHDRWMEGLDEREIKMARRRKREQEKRQREIVEAEERELTESGGKGSLEQRLLFMLKKGETVLEALQRLGAIAKKVKDKAKERHTAEFLAADAMDPDKSFKPRTDIEEITHLASSIMSLGDTDIYSKTYEELVRSVLRSGKVGQNWEPTSADATYEYIWDVPDASQKGETFGPFSEDEMKAWFGASYFGVSGEKVKVRIVGTAEWGDWDDVIL